MSGAQDHDRQAGELASENDSAGRAGATGSPGPLGFRGPPGPPGPLGSAPLIGAFAAAAIVCSTLIIVVISVAGPSVSVPTMPPPAAGPPWWHALHLTATLVTVSLWAALGLGCAGVIAGLVAVQRGARPPVRALIAFAVLVVAVLTVLPAAGSTDAISYAANGRMVVIGHSPYVMTPLQLQRSGDPIGRQIPFSEIPSTWTTTVSVYGPVASGAEWVAAELGGSSLARITFWLKLEEALAFCAVTWMLDRMLRSDPAQRLRAHLLWSVNPLLWWEIVASGHIDGLAAVFGLAGVAALRAGGEPGREPGRQHPGQHPGQRIGVGGALVAGLAIGVATGIKVEYALFGLAVAWACRRSVRPLLAAAAGFAVVVVPSYLAVGVPAIKILLTRSPGITWDTMYQLFWRPVLGYTHFGVTSVPPHLELIAYLLFAAVAVLAVARLPDPVPHLPAVTPALALSLAWLFVTAFQRPWYDVMAISLLALYSASRLDWVVLVRLLAGATVYVQAVQSPVQPHWLADIGQFNGEWLTPGIRLLAAVALVWLCVSGRWGWRSPVSASPGKLPELAPAT
jgi:hypothetical protein